jgi:hypothetical protein
MKKTILSAFIVVLFFAAANRVSAAGLVPCGGPGEASCDLCFLFSLVKTAVDFILLTVIPPVAALIIILSGINLMANRNSPETVNKTKKVLYSTFMGLAIIFTGWVVINTALSAMKVTAWEGTEGKWWKFSLTCAGHDAGYEDKDLEVCEGQE